MTNPDTTREEPEERYLWDRSEPVDPEVRRLEELLGRFGHRAQPAPAARQALAAATRGARPNAPRGTRRALLVALAAGLVALLSGTAWLLVRRSGEPTTTGYVVQGHPTQRVLLEGDWLETGEGGEALVRIADIGTVDVGAASRLRVERTLADSHRLFLERGTLSAAISADPEVFQVGTPAGLSIDLGCLYDLAVEADGATRLAVTSGAVSFEGGGRRVIVPRDARTRATRARGPSSPVWSDASDDLFARVEALDFAEAPPPADIASVVAELTSLTLWHLLQARSEAVRAAAYEALVAQAGAPAGLDRALVLAGDASERARWLPELSWYRTRFASKVRR
jgi:hypothetical protein